MDHHEDGHQHESQHLTLTHEQEQALAVAQAAQHAAQQADIASVVNGAAAAIQAAAAVAAASAWANTAGAAAAIAGDTSEGGSGLELGEPKSGTQKTRRAAWTADEEERLKNLAERYANAGQRMCWRLIAQELNTGRTSKQCREHYLNSLRPNMKKGQWTQKEEYIIAKEHARHGSHWCIIAKKLPGRTDNSIKNFYNATVRSKAVNKNESFLWVYVDKVTRGGLPSKDAFAVATEIWQASVPPHVAQEVFSGAPDDGVEGLMMLAGKRKPEDELAEALLRSNKLHQIMATLGAGNLEELAKRQKLDGLVSPNAAAAAAAGLVAAGLGQDRQRQELLQQLGLAPQQQQQLNDLQVLQQQLLLQQLIAVAHNSAAAAGGVAGSSGGTPPAALPGPPGGTPPNAANSNQLIQLMQQIATQSHMALQQQPQQGGQAGLQQLLSLPGAGGGNSMLSQLLMAQDGGQGGGHMQHADTAAAIAAAAAAAGMEMPGMDGNGAHEVKHEQGADMSGMSDAQMIQAAMAAAQAQQAAAMAAGGVDMSGMPDLSQLGNMANVSVDAVLAALPSGDAMPQQ